MISICICGITKRGTDGPFPQKILYPLTVNFAILSPSSGLWPSSHNPTQFLLHTFGSPNAETLRKILLVIYDFNSLCFATLAILVIGSISTAFSPPAAFFPSFRGKSASSCRETAADNRVHVGHAELKVFQIIPYMLSRTND